MIATFTAADATVVVATVTAIGSVATVIISALTKRETRQLLPNGGSTLADSIHRLELAVQRMADREQSHGERIAALETALVLTRPKEAP